MNDKEIRLSEDEDVERAKQWWADNGRSIVTGVGIGLAVVLGYNFWQSQQAKQAIAASSLYETVVTQSAAGAKQTATQALQDEFGGTVYAQLALLRQAKTQVEADQGQAAVATLRSVMDSKDTGIAAIAALRLATLLVDLGEYDEAENVLNNDLLSADQYAPRVQEIKGDAGVQSGAIEAAKAAYTKSVELLTEQGQATDLVQLKLDNL